MSCTSQPSSLPDGRCRITWRLDVSASGSGVTGDLLAHCIDTALWLNGDITEVNAMTETFVKQRKNVETGDVQLLGQTAYRSEARIH